MRESNRIICPYAIGLDLLTPLTVSLPRFTQPDPMAEKYYPISLYAYCGGDPVNRVDRDGKAWMATIDFTRGFTNGFQWIPENQSYNSDGTLKDGLYHQAIFFSEGGSKGIFDEKSGYNIGTSTAYVYNEDGSISVFDACTHPSDPNHAATVPDGLYDARVGMHHDYIALNLNEVGSQSREIKLVFPNPNKDSGHEGENIASNINVHKAGINNLTGSYTNSLGEERHVSEGCLLIDRVRWDDFIAIFDQKKNRNDPIGVIVSRFLRQPVNKDVGKE